MDSTLDGRPANTLSRCRAIWAPVGRSPLRNSPETYSWVSAMRPCAGAEEVCRPGVRRSSDAGDADMATVAKESLVTGTPQTRQERLLSAISLAQRATGRVSTTISKDSHSVQQ